MSLPCPASLPSPSSSSWSWPRHSKPLLAPRRRPGVLARRRVGRRPGPGRAASVVRRRGKAQVRAVLQGCECARTRSWSQRTRSAVQCNRNSAVCVQCGECGEVSCLWHRDRIVGPLQRRLLPRCARFARVLRAPWIVPLLQLPQLHPIPPRWFVRWTACPSCCPHAVPRVLRGGPPWSKMWHGALLKGEQRAARTKCTAVHSGEARCATLRGRR